jgi:hypothetical protein
MRPAATCIAFDPHHMHVDPERVCAAEIILRCWTGDRHEHERDEARHQLAGCMTASCPRKNVGQMYVRKWVRVTVPASQHELTRAHPHRSPMCTSCVRFARQSVRPASSQDYVVYAMHILCRLLLAR